MINEFKLGGIMVSNISLIRNYVHTIGEYKSDPSQEKQARAKTCIKQLTSKERSYLLKAIHTPHLLKTDQALEQSIIGKISFINGDSTTPVPLVKDAQLNKLGRMRVMTARAAKNLMGFRKDSSKVLNEVTQWTKGVDQVRESLDAYQDPFLYINSVRKKCTREEYIKDTHKACKTHVNLMSNEVLECRREHAKLGLKPGASLWDVDKAFDKLSDNKKNDPDFKKAYLFLHLLKEAEQTFFDEEEPVDSLDQVFKKWKEIKKDDSLTQEEFEAKMKSLVSLTLIFHKWHNDKVAENFG